MSLSTTYDSPYYSIRNACYIMSYLNTDRRHNTTSHPICAKRLVLHPFLSSDMLCVFCRRCNISVTNKDYCNRRFSRHGLLDLQVVVVVVGETETGLGQGSAHGAPTVGGRWL